VISGGRKIKGALDILPDHRLHCANVPAVSGSMRSGRDRIETGQGGRMFFRFDGRQPQVSRIDTYVSETAQVIGDVRIGDHCYIGHGAILRGDYGTIVIGDGTAIEEGVIVHAPPEDVCSIGRGVTIGHGAIVHAKKIGDFAGIGMGAILSIRSEVGDGSIIAEGAVVKREQKIPGSVIAAGNPARKIKDATERERAFWEYGRKIYRDLGRKYCDIGMERIDAP
jgi:carbonic anhydrase/acetyltransferase-like protein (isoleucine patch superfamily)